MYQVDTKSIDKLYAHAVLKSTETSPVKTETENTQTNNKRHTHTHTMNKIKTADKASMSYREEKLTQIGLKETESNRVSIAMYCN